MYIYLCMQSVLKPPEEGKHLTPIDIDDFTHGLKLFYILYILYLHPPSKFKIEMWHFT